MRQNKSFIENSDIKLFLEVIGVEEEDTTNGAEVEVKLNFQKQ